MSKDHQILEKICNIHEVCNEVERLLDVPKKQGRMPSLGESKKADVLSTRLIELIAELPAAPCDQIESPQLQPLAKEALKKAHALLKTILFPTVPERNARTNAARGRLTQYASY